MSFLALSINSWESDHGSEYLTRSEADQKFMKQFNNNEELIEDYETLSTYKGSDVSSDT